MTGALELLLVAVGGALGAALRYLLERGLTPRRPTAFPMGILVANVAGSFLLGVLLAGSGDALLVFAGIGFCGALTTYSTFAHDTVRLAGSGRPITAGANVVVSVAAGLAAVALGYAIGA